MPLACAAQKLVDCPERPLKPGIRKREYQKKKSEQDEEIQEFCQVIGTFVLDVLPDFPEKSADQH